MLNLKIMTISLSKTLKRKRRQIWGAFLLCDIIISLCAKNAKTGEFSTRKSKARYNTTTAKYFLSMYTLARQIVAICIIFTQLLDYQ